MGLPRGGHFGEWEVPELLADEGAGVPEDPRLQLDPEGVVVHRVPALHPDDVTTVDGIRVTSVARTLIDLAEVLDEAALREAFADARARGLLDINAVAASRARVEWRPSLPVLDAVIADFRRAGD